MRSFTIGLKENITLNEAAQANSGAAGAKLFMTVYSTADDTTPWAVSQHAACSRPEKRKILSRSLSYHGTTITTAGVSGHASRKRGLESILDEYATIETPYPLLLYRNKDDDLGSFCNDGDHSQGGG